jgi:hypothetical protein
MAVPVPTISCCVLNLHNLFYQIQNVLAFNRDTCCHLALCLWLLPLHYIHQNFTQHNGSIFNTQHYIIKRHYVECHGSHYTGCLWAERRRQKRSSLPVRFRLSCSPAEVTPSSGRTRCRGLRPPGPNVIKLFSFVTDDKAKYARVFVTGNPFPV